MKRTKYIDQWLKQNIHEHLKDKCQNVLRHLITLETLRKYPNLPILDRVPIRDYILPGTKVTIEKGTPVYISLMGIQMDPDVYPDPEKFDPERFNQENIKKRNPYMYMPFGEGPKYCIGMRFGLQAVKTGLVSILSNFEVSSCVETPIPLVLSPKYLILASEGGMPLKFTKLKH